MGYNKRTQESIQREIQEKISIKEATLKLRIRLNTENSLQHRAINRWKKEQN